MSEVIAYCRVSTLGQSNSGQLDSINRYCSNLELKLTRQIEQQISSRKEKSKRLSWLDELLPGDILVVAELSRLGRSMSELILTINEIEQKGVELHIIDRKLVIRKDSPSLETSITLGLFSILAQVERQLCVDRTKRGLQASDKKGGRPRGTKYDLTQITDALNASNNIQEASRLINVPATTVRSLVKSKYILKENDIWKICL